MKDASGKLRGGSTVASVLVAMSCACSSEVSDTQRDHCEGEVLRPPSLDMTVLDARSSELICDAMVDVTMNGMQIVVFGDGPPQCRYYTAGGKATYVVIVSAPGYAPANPITVEVDEGPECGFPITEQVDILLEAL